MAGPPGAISLEGSDRVKLALEKLVSEVGNSSIKSVGLTDRTRNDGETNEGILIEQRDKFHRDICTANQEDADKAAESFAALLEVEIQRAMEAGATGRTADSLMAMGLRNAMISYCEAVSGRIDKQINSDGSALTELSKSYAVQKMKAVGFIKPILVRTGQLRDALNPTEAAKNLKYSRS